jgi:hypothetical protein
VLHVGHGLADQVLPAQRETDTHRIALVPCPVRQVVRSGIPAAKRTFVSDRQFLEWLWVTRRESEQCAFPDAIAKYPQRLVDVSNSQSHINVQCPPSTRGVGVPIQHDIGIELGVIQVRVVQEAGRVGRATMRRRETHLLLLIRQLGRPIGCDEKRPFDRDQLDLRAVLVTNPASLGRKRCVVRDSPHDPHP